MSEAREKLLKLTETVLEKAKKAGADTAQCDAGEKRTQEFNIAGGEWTLMRTLYDRSLSVTVFKDNKKGSVAINSFDEAAVDQAISDALSSASEASADDAWEINSEASERDFANGDPEPDTELLFKRTKELVDTIAKEHPKIVLEELIASHERTERVYRNTHGVRLAYTGGFYQLMTGYAAHEGDVTTSATYDVQQIAGLDRPFIECGMLKTGFKNAEASLYPVPTEGKYTGTVVFTPFCMMDMLGMMADALLSDMPILDKTSVFSDRLGEEIADKRITISIAPLDKRIAHGERYTGEGYVSKDYDLIRDGVLKSFMISRYVANKTGNEMALNTSNASVVKNGDQSFEELVASVDKGIIVGSFSGGMPGANGEFSGVAKNGFRIENGKITEAITETMISGNFAEMLKSLHGISKETLDNGMASVPYMAFDGITISGK